MIAFKFSSLHKKIKYNVYKYWSLNHLMCIFSSLLKLYICYYWPFDSSLSILPITIIIWMFSPSKCYSVIKPISVMVEVDCNQKATSTLVLECYVIWRPLPYSNFSKKIKKINEISKLHKEWKIHPPKCRYKRWWAWSEAFQRLASLLEAFSLVV
jgi:hypothetical protein